MSRGRDLSRLALIEVTYTPCGTPSGMAQAVLYTKAMLNAMSVQNLADLEAVAERILGDALRHVPRAERNGGSMIRITRIENPAGATDVVRLRVEGRLTAATIEEFDNAAAAVLPGARGLVVDLFGLRFIDAAGAAILKQLESKGAVLVGASEFLVTLMRKASAAPAKATPGEPAAERQLIERLRREEAGAYEELVRRYGGRMHTTALRLLRNADDASDAVQDAFLSAFKGLTSFAGDSRLSTWLHRITVNAALMKLRSRARKPEQPIDDLLPQFDERGHWATDERPWEIPCDEAIARKETRAMVRACIDKLPESYRTALVLRDIEDLDNDEVAAMLGISSNAAKIRVHRARQALRTLLAQSFAAVRSPE